LTNNIKVYEYVEDDAAQPADAPDLPIEEYLRQEVPRIFQNRLEAELNEINENDGETPQLGDLEASFVQSLTRMIKDAQDHAISAYNMHLPNNPSSLNVAITPPSSSGASTAPPISKQELKQDLGPSVVNRVLSLAKEAQIFQMSAHWLSVGQDDPETQFHMMLDTKAQHSGRNKDCAFMDGQNATGRDGDRNQLCLSSPCPAETSNILNEGNEKADYLGGNSVVFSQPYIATEQGSMIEFNSDNAWSQDQWDEFLGPNVDTDGG
jgi:hypothetical protein